MKTKPNFALEALAIAYGSTRQSFRHSEHSFTGYVLECYFDDPHMLIAFVAEAQIQIDYFVAIRVVSETEAYASVPCEDLPF